MGRKSKVTSTATVFSDCCQALLTDSPDFLIATAKLLSGLVKRARSRKDLGQAIYMLDNCPAIDAGAILMLMYCGYELSALGWRATVSGEGESMELVARHVEHYLRDHSQRGECKRKNGDYLLRNIDDRKQMVTEISEWANSVQKETRASAEAVALWKSQISEVTTNGFQHGIGNSIAKRPLLIAGKASEDHSRVQLAALDFGKSIPVTIANEAARMHVPIGDGDRIRFACRKGVTSHSTPINQGSGLFNLIETVKKNGGSLAILSRNGLLHVVGGRCYKRNLPLQMVVNPLLQGTLTVVNLKIC